MSWAQTRNARRVWRLRSTGASRIYTLYASALVALIVVFPVARALWRWAVSPAGLMTLASPGATTVLGCCVAALWGGSLFLGSKRGPVLLPPFLLYALSTSALRRSVSLRSPVAKSVWGIGTVFAFAASFVGCALATGGYTGVLGAAVFGATGFSAGVIADALWLTGQAFPRAALPAAVCVALLTGISLTMPQLVPFTPWGWVSATYPTAELSLVHVLGLALTTVLGVGVIPALLNRLTWPKLKAQSARWQQATAFSYSFDFAAAATLYESSPRVGRHLRAVQASTRLWATFMRRDAIGQLRTPAATAGALGVVALAAALLTVSSVPGSASPFLAAAAGVLLFIASGHICKSLRYAALVTGDFPLFRVNDGVLLCLHMLYPLTALTITLSVASTSTALVLGVPIWSGVFSACAVGLFTLALRVSHALKCHLPTVFLTPVVSPVGDLGILVRLGWGFAEPLLASLCAISVAYFTVAPLPCVVLVCCVGVLLWARWHSRRAS